MLYQSSKKYKFSSNKWTPLRKSCPVCFGAKSNCSQSPDFQVIRCRLSTDKSGEWIRTSTNSIGFGIWRKESEIDAYQQESPQARAARAAESQQRREIQFAQERQRVALLLSPEESDREIRSLLEQLPLVDSDRQALKNKGLSERQIDEAGYRSLTQKWQKLDQAVSDRLPGLRSGGQRVNNPNPGILCPIPDEQGLYRTIRQYNPDLSIYSEDDRPGKYVWLSSSGRGLGVQDENKKLPITTRYPNEPSSLNRIGLCEGLEIKSLLSAERLGIPMIASSGHALAGNPIALQRAIGYTMPKAIAMSSENLDHPIITIYGDAGAVLNEAVWRDYLKAARLLESWGYQVEFAWWGQIEKSRGDIDEIDLATTAITYISPDEFEDLVWQNLEPEQPITSEPDPIEPDPEEYQNYLDWFEEQEQVEQAIERSEFKNWLFLKVKKLGKKALTKGFSRFSGNIDRALPKSLRFDPETPLPTPNDYKEKQPPKILFKKGQRHQVIAKLRLLGWKFSLDRSFMGLGKSHDLGLLANLSGKTWYLDLNHRNPTVSTVENGFVDLPVRHGGLVKDPIRSTPSGQPHLHWAKPGETPDTTSLCQNSELFIKLYGKGYVPDDFKKDSVEDTNLNPICKSCELAYACANGFGNGYGFRFARKEALQQSRIRASINSLPTPGDDYSYSNDIAIVDEASQVISGSKSISAGIKDVLFELSEYEKFPLLYQIIRPYFNQIIPLLKGHEKLPRYGLEHSEIIELLGNPPKEIKEIIEIVIAEAPDLSSLIVIPEKISGWGSYWKASMKSANSYLQNEARLMTTELIDNLPNNFLINLLLVWSGTVTGALRIDARRQLIVTIKQNRHAKILNQMNQVIMLDATADKEFIAEKLEVNPNSIIEIEQELPPLNNLTVFNVHLDGLSSNQISPNCQHRLVKLIEKLEEEHEEISLLGIKKYQEIFGLDGYWFADNRGTNTFKGKKAIAAFGKPQINVGAAKDEYLAVHGSIFGFEAHYQRLTNAEVTQLTGRPRAHLFPDEEFAIYLIGTRHYTDHLDKLGINIVNIDAFELTPKAGTRSQISKAKMVRAIQALANQGKKLSMRAIADAAGLSADYIKLLAQDLDGMVALKKWVEVLYSSYRTSTQKLDSSFLLEQDKIRLWMNLNPVEAAQKVFQALQDYGWRDFQLYLDNFSVGVQASMWAMILPLILDSAEISELQALIYPPPE